MKAINMNKVIVAGLVAGLIINVSEFVLNAIVLEAQWQAVMKSLNRNPTFSTNQIIGFNVIGFVIGILLMWLYAALKPRFEGQSAIVSALVIWVTAYALAMSGPAIVDLFPLNLVCISLAWGLVEVVIAAVVGAKLYKEPATMAATA